MGPQWARGLLLILFMLVLSGCGGSGSPVDAMRRSLDRYPEYSVILNDMNSKGLFFHDYFHRYRVIFPESGQKSGDGEQPKFTQKMTDWVKVNEGTFNKYRDALGMVILAKKPDGTIDTTPQPPHFQFVGDPRFGRWETDSKGSNSWAWFATGMVASRLMEGLFDTRSQVDYRHWQDYNNSRKAGSPYYGSKDPQGRPQYGTQGTVTQKSNPGFFEQQQTRMAEKKESFGQKVESRMGRSRPTPSGSSGFSSGGRSSFSVGGRSRR
jgi:hypothetical protein